MTHFWHYVVRSRGSLAARVFIAVVACVALLPGSLGAERIELVSEGDLQTTLEWRPSPVSPEIVESARATQLELERLGVLDARRAADAPSFSWPLRQNSRFDHPACWGAVSFVDHDEDMGEIALWQVWHISRPERPLRLSRWRLPAHSTVR